VLVVVVVVVVAVVDVVVVVVAVVVVVVVVVGQSNSSDSSSQFWTPSHCCDAGMHVPFLHMNSSSSSQMYSVSKVFEHLLLSVHTLKIFVILKIRY